MLYEEVFKSFESAGIRYLVVGGIAVNLHGYARLTVDLDLMLDLSQENLLKVIQVMESLGYAPRVPVNARDLASDKTRDRWKKEKGALVFTFVDSKAPFRQVDIFLENPIDFDQAHARRTPFELKGITVPAASIDDLIQLKSAAGRPRDREDIHHLQEIKRQKGSS
ncbi:MAG: nucleotidyl transferase AbiEii/AbiGii toxin family protein [Nitrospirota bacterium]